MLTQWRVHIAFTSQWSRYSSVASEGEALLPPQQDGSEKEYSSKIRQLVDDISKLTVLEVSDLNELLKTTLKISDIASVPAVPAPTVAVATPDSNEDSPAQQQSEFTVKLTGFADGTKAKVIKEIKTIMEGMNLVQAKKFVEDAPQIVRKEVSKEEAEELKKILETAGATVQLE